MGMGKQGLNVIISSGRHMGVTPITSTRTAAVGYP